MQLFHDSQLPCHDEGSKVETILFLVDLSKLLQCAAYFNSVCTEVCFFDGQGSKKNWFCSRKGILTHIDFGDALQSKHQDQAALTKPFFLQAQKILIYGFR